MANYSPYDNNKNRSTNSTGVGQQNRPAPAQPAQGQPAQRQYGQATQGQYGRPAQGQFERPANNFSGGQRREEEAKITAEEMPKNYTEFAEDAIRGFGSNKVKTTKLRNLLGMFSSLYDNVCKGRDDKLSIEQQNRLTGARMRMIYECGRDEDVKRFIKNTKLISYLLSVQDSKEKFKQFYHYVEALVAYHRYIYGDVK